MVKSTIAKRYALSYLSNINKEDYNQGVENCRIFNEVLSNFPQLTMLLESPAISIEEKREIINAISKSLNFDENFISFLNLLVENRRISIFGDITLKAEEIVDSFMGIVKGEIVSFKPLSKEKKETIEREVSKRIGKKTILIEKRDESVLGGFKVKVGSLVFDATYRNALNEIKNYLLKGIKYG